MLETPGVVTYIGVGVGTAVVITDIGGGGDCCGYIRYRRGWGLLGF